MISQSFVYLSNSGPSGLSFSNNSKARKSHAFVTSVSGENNYNFVFCMVLISQAIFACWHGFLIKLVNIPQQRSTKEGFNQKGWIGWIGP